MGDGSLGEDDPNVVTVGTEAVDNARAGVGSEASALGFPVDRHALTSPQGVLRILKMTDGVPSSSWGERTTTSHLLTSFPCSSSLGISSTILPRDAKFPSSRTICQPLATKNWRISASFLGYPCPDSNRGARFRKPLLCPPELQGRVWALSVIMGVSTRSLAWFP